MLKKITEKEFSEHCDKLDCNRFTDVWNKSNSVIIRKWYNVNGFVGLIINWTTYCIETGDIEDG